MRIFVSVLEGVDRWPAARFGSGHTECDPMDRAGEIGELTPRRTGSSPGAHEGFILRLIEERKGITLNEMVELLAADRALQCDRL